MTGVAVHTHTADCRGCRRYRPTLRRSEKRLHMIIKDMLDKPKVCFHVRTVIVSEPDAIEGHNGQVIDGGVYEVCLDCRTRLRVS
jgi:hypothetical protein